MEVHGVVAGIWWIIACPPCTVLGSTSVSGAVDRAVWAVQEGMLPLQAEVGGMLGCATSQAFVFKGTFVFML